MAVQSCMERIPVKKVTEMFSHSRRHSTICFVNSWCSACKVYTDDIAMVVLELMDSVDTQLNNPQSYDI